MTRLAFGCASLLRLPAANARQALLEAAYESGIRHFDVARSYGLGMAERELRSLVRVHRDTITIATKFGIAAPRAAGWIQAPARALLARLPALRSAARRASGAFPSGRHYSVESARASLGTSLRELQCDFVDAFFIHDPAPDAQIDAALEDFLGECVQRGTIRTFGVSGSYAAVSRLCTTRPGLCLSVQFDSDILSGHREAFRAAPAQSITTFSPLAMALPRLLALSNAGAIDLSDTDEVAARLLAHAQSVNPGGAVVFSTTQPARLRRLVQRGVALAQADPALAEFAQTLRTAVRASS